MAYGLLTTRVCTIEATRKEMSDARLPLAYRDSCAHLLIPLNKCRYDNYYLNWRCQVGRVEYDLAREGEGSKHS